MKNLRRKREWFSLVELFYRTMRGNEKGFTSMEQLWLAFVMKENYKNLEW